MKKLNKKYADLLHQASIATGRKEAVGLLHKAAKLQTKFDEKSKRFNSLWFIFCINQGAISSLFYGFLNIIVLG